MDPTQPTERPAGDASFEKLQANFTLGLSANFFTLAGLVGTWIFLAKAGWVEGFWEQLQVTLSLAPVFMGDAINAYVLGRIRLETQRGWNDVQITPAGTQQVIRWYIPFRMLSFATAVTLAFLLIRGCAPQGTTLEFLRPLFAGLFALVLFRTQFFYYHHLIPAVPKLGASFGKRLVIVTGIGILWTIWLWTRNPFPLSHLGTIGHGLLYFLLCGILQPLPSRFSIFRRSSGGRRAPLAGIEHPTPESVPLLRDPQVTAELELWKAQGFTSEWHPVHMPLIELPIFEATGVCALRQDLSAVLLLLSTEVKKQRHRTLISWSTGKAFLTTDFGAPNAKFPDSVHYTSCPRETGPGAFWDLHSGKLPGPADPLPSPVWPKLEELIVRMRQFLARGLSPTAAAGPPSGADLVTQATAPGAALDTGAREDRQEHGQ